MTCIVTTGTLTIGSAGQSLLSLNGEKALSLNASCEVAGTYTVVATGVSSAITWSADTGVVSGTGDSREVTFSSAGNHTVTVTGTSDDGVAVTDSVAVVVAQGACDQSLSSVSIQGPSSLALGVGCSAAGSYTVALNKATNATWSIMPATAMISAAGKVTFTKAGSYTVSVSAEGEDGTISDSITTSVTQGECLENTFTATLDPSEILTGEAAHISWMGQKVGSVVATSDDDLVITQTPEGFVVSSEVEGDYVITVTATHEDGSTSVETLNVSVYRPESLKKATIIIKKRVPVGGDNGCS